MKTFTSFDVFCLFHNAKLICKNGKNISLDNKVFPGIYERTKEQFKERYKKIWNEIENNLYTFDQLKLYVLYRYLFEKNITVINIVKSEIIDVNGLFTQKRLDFDKEMLLQVKEWHKVNHIKSLFETTEEGESVTYDLTKKKFLSPMVFITCIDKLKDEDNKNKEYLRFKNVIRIIKQELNKRNK